MKSKHFTCGLVLLSMAALVVTFVVASVSTALALPVSGNLSVVGVYENTEGAFGIAYDPVNDVIHYTQGDAGDNDVHTVKAFKNYTAAELAGFTSVTIDGDTFPRLSLVEGQHDVAGSTTPLVGSAHFSALAFNTATGQLVQTNNGGDVQAYDPFTGANQNTILNVGSGFADGLDFDGANRWFSPDVQSIFNNGVKIFDNTNTDHTDVGTWFGLGPDDIATGWSGIEQIGDSLFAVAVFTNADVGRSRTIVRFDLNTNTLVGYDDDGHLTAARWEDLAFDGRFLYAADLRGDLDSNQTQGDIYVFDVTGGLAVPEPATMTLLGISLVGLAGASARRKLKKKAVDKS